MEIAPKYTLSVVTVASHDIVRLKKTLDSFQGAPAWIEFVVICPSSDSDTISFVNSCIQSCDFSLVLYNDEGGGVYQAMNLGVECSSGEYVVFWNAGDLCVSIDSLCDLTLKLKKHSPSWAITKAVFDWRESQVLSEKNLKSFALQRGGYISHQTVIMSRYLFLKIGGFDVKYKVAADTKLITQFWRKFAVDFYEINTVKVEFPNFSGKHNKRGRIENLMICLLILPLRSKLLSFFFAVSREIEYAFVRATR